MLSLAWCLKFGLLRQGRADVGFQFGRGRFHPLQRGDAHGRRLQRHGLRLRWAYSRDHRTWHPRACLGRRSPGTALGWDRGRRRRATQVAGHGFPRDGGQVRRGGASGPGTRPLPAPRMRNAMLAGP
jgi:hypothetical protein